MNRISLRVRLISYWKYALPSDSFHIGRDFGFNQQTINETIQKGGNLPLRNVLTATLKASGYPEE